MGKSIPGGRPAPIGTCEMCGRTGIPAWERCCKWCKPDWRSYLAIEAAEKRAAAPPTNYAERYCARCDKPLRPSAPETAHFCSERCRSATYREEHRDELREKARQRTRVQTPEQRKATRERYKEIRRRFPRFYAESERKATESRRRASQVRRARKYGAGYERVDLEALWATSDHTCGLCGELIDDALEWPDPMSRSLDHIIPLSRGGAHRADNLQWAHLTCNVRKGNRLDAAA